MLTRDERRRGGLVLVLMCVMALFEVVGVAAVMPFLAVLADPGAIDRSPALSRLYGVGGFTSDETFLMALGLGAFALVILSAVIRSISLYSQTRFLHMCRHTLSCRLLEGYLGQPYEFFLARNTGDMSKNILSEVDHFVDRVLLPMGGIASYGIVLMAVVAFLLVIEPSSAIMIAVVLGLSYGAAYLVVRRVSNRITANRMAANRHRFEIAAEAFGGIKGIKVLGRERQYLARFSQSTRVYSQHLATSSVLGLIPKYAVEAIAFGGIIVMALHMMMRQGSDDGRTLATVLPLLGLYAFAGYRLLPAVQGLYQNFTTLRFTEQVIALVKKELALAGRREQRAGSTGERRPMSDGIELRNVTYQYPTADRPGLSDISLRIPARSTLGIVGSTGAGKSTLVDVLLGLLEPTDGAILIDGAPLTKESVRAWQDRIGYVPQNIFLSDATIYENIAFGLGLDELDTSRVQACARAAKVSDFVESLPDGYRTRVGERGVRLSGGQLQRIGIARALYDKPDVIILDEATSALDNLTEAEVMQTINSLPGDRIIIMIAHRLTTVKGCDQILVLHRGQATGLGSYQELLADHTEFRKMVDMSAMA
ncbi:ABC transporter ATP-binding protein [Rubellimicrobium roseum]|nr:ABC transporter ATP-binding protein [Rubellimicrobium roseum]